MISKILVPTDGSKIAQKAVIYAIDLAKQLKASVFALSIVDKRFYMPLAITAADISMDIPALIIMGSHGRSALASTILGSVTYGVIHKDTKIPVMVVKG